MLGNTSDIRKKTEECNKDEACYGGFGGRFSYEAPDSRAARILTKLAIGTAACLLFGVLGTLCGILMFSVVSDNHSLYYSGVQLPSLAADDTAAPADDVALLANADSNISVIRNSAAVENVTEEISRRYRVPVGVMIHELSEYSPLCKAGLLNGDIIVELDGVDITDCTQLSELISESKGKTVPISVFRNNSYVKLYASFD